LRRNEQSTLSEQSSDNSHVNPTDSGSHETHSYRHFFSRLVAAFVGVGFYPVSVSERGGVPTLGRAAAHQQLSIRPVQFAGFHRRLCLAGVCHCILGLASASAGSFIRHADNTDTQ
jgi:hypothetical protein